MEPANPQRPVMDVTTRARATAPESAAPTSMSRREPVHTAPPIETESKPLPSSEIEKKTVAEKETKPEEITQASALQPKRQQAAPVGTIVVTIMLMLALAGLAIVVYIKS